METEELRVLFHACTLGRADIANNALTSMRSRKLMNETDFVSLISTPRVEDGLTPLHIASMNGSVDVIRSLLTAKASLTKAPDFGDHCDERPYDVAVDAAKEAYHVFVFEQIAMGAKEAVVDLLEGGIPVDVKDGSSFNDSTLHWAASFGSLEVAKLLLSYGCSVDIRNSNEQTPLFEACKNGNVEMVYLLLDEGSDVSATDKFGKTPKQYANKNKVELEPLLDNPPVPTFPFSSLKRQPQHAFRAASLLEGTSRNTEDLNAAESNPDSVGFHDDLLSSTGHVVEEEEGGKSPLLVLWPPVQRQFHTGTQPLTLRSDEVILASHCDGEAALLHHLEVSGLMSAVSSYGMVVRPCFELHELSQTSSKCIFSINRVVCPGRHRFELTVHPVNGIRIIASDETGLLYGSYVLIQLCQLHSDIRMLEGQTSVSVPPVTLVDWPDLPNRGVLWCWRENARMSLTNMLDVVRFLSRLRINLLLLQLDASEDNAKDVDASINERNAVGEIASISAERATENLSMISRYGKEHHLEVIPSFTVHSLQCQLPIGSLKFLNANASFVSLTLQFDLSDVTQELLLAGCKKSGQDLVVAAVEACRDSCRQLFNVIREAGYKTLLLACDDWTRKFVVPQTLAQEFGFDLIDRKEKDVFDMNLFIKPIGATGEFLRRVASNVKSAIDRGHSLNVLPVSMEIDICCPIFVQKYCCFVFAGFAWNSVSILDMVQGENLAMSDWVAGNRKDGNERKSPGSVGIVSDSSFPVPSSVPIMSTILSEVLSLLIFDIRAEQASPAYCTILNAFTGQLLLQAVGGVRQTGLYQFSTAESVNQDLTPVKSSNGSTKEEPPAPSLEDIVAAEQQIWLLLVAPRSRLRNCVAPSRAATALCLRIYRQMLSSSCWKDKATAPKKGFLAAMTGFTPFFGSEECPPVIEAEVEEFYCIINLLSVLCRSVMMGYLALEKQKIVSSTPSYEQLQEALSPGTKSDLANLFLEALEKCSNSLRRRYESLWFLAEDWSQREYNEERKNALLAASGREVMDIEDRYRPQISIREFLCTKYPPIPLANVFRLISSKLPIPEVASESLNRLFPTSTKFENS